ncbi:MFS transporter [Longispora albida]|uniref:MFS transporter n=1 Tax=Longispora albida TaxID=203523 RepID=UPI00036016CF|nr:MFS transporter [Longispora albida]
MRGIPRIVWTLAAGRFVNAIGSFVSLYLFLYLSGPRGLSLTTAGLISGGLGAGVLIGNFTGGWFGDHYGHRRVMLLASTVGGIGVMTIPWQPVWLLFLAMPVLGYAGATAGVSQGALVALAVEPGDRRRSVAVSRAAFNAGCVIGPPLGALLMAYNIELLFVLDGLVTLAVRAVTARLLPGEPPREPIRPGKPAERKLWRAVVADRSLLILLPAIVVVDLVYRQLYSTLPVYLRDSGHPVGLYAALIAIGSGMILCLEIPAAVALRKRPALVIIAAGYGLVGLGFAVFGLGRAAWLMVAAMVVLTIGEILYKTTATAHVLDSAPPGMEGRYQGLYMGAATSGSMLAPPVGALVYGLAPGLLWPLCALAALAAALIAWRARCHDRGTPQVAIAT